MTTQYVSIYLFTYMFYTLKDFCVGYQTISLKDITAKKDEVSPNFLSGKFWGNGHISHNFPKGKWKFSFPLNFPEKLVHFP